MHRKKTIRKNTKMLNVSLWVVGIMKNLIFFLFSNFLSMNILKLDILIKSIITLLAD